MTVATEVEVFQANDGASADALDMAQLSFPHLSGLAAAGSVPRP